MKIQFITGLLDTNDSKVPIETQKKELIARKVNKFMVGKDVKEIKVVDKYMKAGFMVYVVMITYNPKRTKVLN